MSNAEKETIIKTALEKQDVFMLKSVMQVNHNPHPYMIGPQHIKEANMFIDEAVCRKVQCAHPKCRVPYDEHTFECVAFLSVIRNATNNEANVALKALVVEIGKTLVDGFAFVESEFKITS